MKKTIAILLFHTLIFLAGCATPPDIPIITGIEEGRVYPSGVVISVEPQDRVDYTASIDGEPYTLGSFFEEDGTHIFHVTAANQRNELTSEATVHFEIDTVPPDVPVITGVTENEVYFQSVTIGVQPAEGVTYDAAIDGAPYQIGTPFTADGPHTLSVTARKTKNGLTSQIDIPFALDNRTYTQEEVDYFTEISLGTEYGGAASICKWTADIRITAYGAPTGEDLATLDTVIAELRDLTKLDISIVSADGNIDIYFIPDYEFIDYIPSYVEGNWGYFSYYIRDEGEIWQARIGIDTQKTNQLSRNHLIREEFTQSFGMGNDSDKYEDSMFYQPWTLTQSYSAMDKKVIELLYRDDILPGMTGEEIYDVLEPRIVKE